MKMCSYGVLAHPLFKSVDSKNTSATLYCLVLLLLMGYSLISPTNYLFSLGETMFDIETLSMEIGLSVMKNMFFITVAFIAFFIYIWSMYYMPSSYKLGLFYYSLLAFVFSMLLLIVSSSLLLVFVGWEGLGVTSFILIIFYQNWSSGKGGLLTLLTNRLGDAVLLILFCVWISNFTMSISMSSSLIYFVLLGSLVLTKSAQWPFSSWLPAAMAAPTPVSSLVHSSTLVTAGVWLLLRFMTPTTFNMIMVALLGTLTLLLASLSALMEVDAKKIVALSTLSQLGLMFLTLSVSSKAMCFLHVITHALAKANLFMIIGSVLHSSFSQQDARFLLTNAFSKFLYLSGFLSLLSLTGWVFTSGFYSKELILMSSTYNNLNSVFASVLLVVLSSLTLAYCLKLFNSITVMSTASNFHSFASSINQLIPIFFLSISVVFMGFILSVNLVFTPFILMSVEGLYWTIAFFGMLFFYSSFLKPVKVFFLKGFLMQVKFIDLMLKSLFFTKSLTVMLESSLSESGVLVTPLVSSKSLKLGARVVPFLVVLGAVLIWA